MAAAQGAPAMTGVFSRIYRRNEWNGTATRSGPGSNLEPTARVREALQQLVEWLDLQSVVDAACGEGLWQPELPGYLGLDVAPEAIEAARRNHPEREYRVHDVRRGCPTADLVLCRDVIQHLSLRDGRAVLGAIRESGSRWLLASTYVGTRNRAISSGGYYSPNLEAAPFELPPALLLLHDGYDYGAGTTLRDPTKMLGLWRLPW
jgi:SAM-dependent methyltransferase